MANPSPVSLSGFLSPSPEVQEGISALERDRCAKFLEDLADLVPAEKLDTKTLRLVAGYLKNRPKWQEILEARRKATQGLPWE